jgi:hypothetical protein
MPQLQPQQIVPLISIALVAGIVIFRNMKPRQLRLELLWIRPVVIMVVAAAFLLLMPFPHQSYAIPALIGAALVGAGIGYLRGRMVRVIVDPETHTAMSQASPLGVALILVIIGARYVLNSSMGGQSGHPNAQAMLLTDALLLFGAGIVGVTGLEVWMRASRMIGRSKAAKAAA